MSNVAAQESLRFDGIYVSEPSFERLDQTWFRYYFRFYPDGMVLKGSCPSEINIKLLQNKTPKVGSGTYRTISGDIVEFDIGSTGYKFKSKWSGVLNDGDILFTIQNEDFEDIDGLYRFFKFEQ